MCVIDSVMSNYALVKNWLKPELHEECKIQRNLFSSWLFDLEHKTSKIALLNPMVLSSKMGWKFCL